MARKGKLTHDDGKAGIRTNTREKDNTKEDDRSGCSGASVQQKVKKRRRKAFHRQRRQKVQSRKAVMLQRWVELNAL